MNHQRTPCVGICSTTYGDLVCRGCKRFAHEIVMWNGFEEDQRSRVWERLNALRAGAVGAMITIKDPQQLLAGAISLRVPTADRLSMAQLACEVLRRLPGGRPQFESVGLALVTQDTPELTESDPARILKQIEGEFYQRSLAHYEHNFKTPVE